MHMSHEAFRPPHVAMADIQEIVPRRRHVALMDDDRDGRETIRAYLDSHAFDVSPVNDTAGLGRLLASRHVDLVILDLKRGRELETALMRDLGAKTDAPIIILSDRDEEADKVEVLELGADDYLAKPYGPRELLARIRANIRRAERAAGGFDRKPERMRYAFGGWELSMRTRKLLAPGGQPVRLTTGEFNLLAAFLRAPQQVLSREQLITASRVHSDEVFDRSIDVLVMRLRRKLAVYQPDAALITTERGAGYLFTLPVQMI